MRREIKRLLTTEISRHITLHDGRSNEANFVGQAGGPRQSAQRILAEMTVYSARLGSVAMAGVQDATRTGVIILLDSPPAHTVHIEITDISGSVRVDRVSTGAIAVELEKAISKLRKWKERSRQKTQLRIFRVPSMHMSALWLHHQSNLSFDKFVPYTANFAQLGVGRMYSNNRFDLLMKKAATASILRWYESHEKASHAAKMANLDSVPAPSNQKSL